MKQNQISDIYSPQIDTKVISNSTRTDNPAEEQKEKKTLVTNTSF